MGKLSIFLVAAATVAAAVSMSGMYEDLRSVDQTQNRTRRGVLAEERARSAHNQALYQLEQSAGEQHISPPSISLSESGGRFEVDGQSTGSYITFVARGYAGKAGTSARYAHDIVTRYDTEGGYPFPASTALSGGYITVERHPDARIESGADGPPVRVDLLRARELLTRFPLSDLLSLDTMKADIEAAIEGSGSGVAFYDDLDKWLEEQDDQYALEALYHELAALSSADFRPSTDAVYEDTAYFSGIHNFGALSPNQTSVVRLKEGGVVKNGALVNGHGILLVEGDLIVKREGRLNWDGLVFVRGDPQEPVNVHLDGLVDFRGSMIAVQDQKAPGGHMDVTTFAQGPDRSGTRFDPIWGSFGTVAEPWLRHNHKFDEEMGTMRLRFKEPGGVYPQEAQLGLQQALSLVSPDTPLWIKFYTVDYETEQLLNHGYSLIDWRTSSDGYQGALWNGVQGEDGSFSTPYFTRSELEKLVIDVQFLRYLKHMLDEEGTAPKNEGPRIVARDWARQHALRFAVKAQPSGYSIYHATIYWHERVDEQESLEEEEQEIREQITSDAFGLDVRLGENVSIQYDQEALRQPALRMNLFKGLRHEWTASYRWDGERSEENDPPSIGGRIQKAVLNHETLE